MKKLDETSKAYRDFGTDLLRIILMAMIVFHHMIVHGFGLSGLQNGQMMGGIVAQLSRQKSKIFIMN